MFRVCFSFSKVFTTFEQTLKLPIDKETAANYIVNIVELNDVLNKMAAKKGSGIKMIWCACVCAQ